MNVFLPNFTFEDELCGRTEFSAATRQIHRELAPLTAFMCRPGDCVVVPEIPDSEWRQQWRPGVDFATTIEDIQAQNSPQVVPWGWSPVSRSQALKLGCSAEQIPSEQSVETVNSRRFNADFDPVIELDLNGQGNFSDVTFGRFCATESEWRQAVVDFAAEGFARWVTKPQISHAGRNRLLGEGSNLNAQQAGWLQRHLPHGVYVEPWVRVVEEWGLQFQLSADRCPATVRLIGVTQLLNDPVGRYLGSLFSHSEPSSGPETGSDEVHQLAVRHGFDVCRAAAACGYYGPLGIDAYVFEMPKRGRWLRVCNDINGRLTMGRLALELRPQLKTGEFGLWMQIDAALMGKNPQNARKTPSGTISMTYVCRRRVRGWLAASVPNRYDPAQPGPDLDNCRAAAEEFDEKHDDAPSVRWNSPTVSGVAGHSETQPGRIRPVVSWAFTPFPTTRVRGDSSFCEENTLRVLVDRVSRSSDS
ncbi:MAG: hypothetical protein R3C49_08445 [Planctomycetaceae bacterium]